MENKVKGGPVDPTQSLPNPMERRRIRSGVRAGLVFRLASACMFTARAVALSSIGLVIYDSFIIVIIHVLAITGGVLGLVGSITVSNTLSRRASPGVTLALVGAFIVYIVLYFGHDLGVEASLASLIGMGIVWTFPQVCVSFVLWRKGWFPKVMALVACVYGIYLVLWNSIQYLAYYAHEIVLDHATYDQVSTLGTVVLYVVSLLWCGLWVDLNTRSRQYLAAHLFRALPLSTQSLRRRGNSLMCAAFGYGFGWFMLESPYMARLTQELVSNHGWSFTEALREALIAGGAWFSIPICIILLLVGIVSIRQSNRPPISEFLLGDRPSPVQKMGDLQVVGASDEWIHLDENTLSADPALNSSVLTLLNETYKEAKAGHKKTTKRYLHVALKLCPQSFTSFQNAAVLLLRIGKYKDAEKTIWKMIQFQGTNPGAWNMLGFSLLCQNQWQKAFDAFSKAAKGWKLDKLGFIFLEKNQPDAILQLIDMLKKRPL